MTKRRYLRARPRKEIFFARADETENAGLSLNEMLSRVGPEVQGSEFGYGPSVGNEGFRETERESASLAEESRAIR
ncbi:MAG TPA: hypothetical protein VEE84_03020 [Burkholderiaceae bacterium]|nr:hypothetical protein [Burkholderiaceae bacterium]